jgi:hypothetical protein
LTCPTLSLSPTGKTTIELFNNLIVVDVLTLDGNIIASDNKFSAYTGTSILTYPDIRISILKCVDNTFENFLASNRYKFWINKYNENSVMSNNTFKNVYFFSYNLDNDMEYSDSQFYNCRLTVQSLDKTKNASINFVRCTLIDSGVNLGGRYTNDVTTTGVTTFANFVDSKIKLTENYLSEAFVVINDNKDSASGLPSPYRNYEASFKNSSIESTIISRILVLMKYESAGATFDLLSNKKIITNASSIKVSDITKFKLLVDKTSNVACLIGTTLIGFASFTNPVNGKIEIFDSSYSYSGAVAPTTLKPEDVSYWFNTTVNKPFWSNGTNWVDAMGTTLV